MPKEQLYKKYAKFYDKIYSEKKYDDEVDFINSIIKNFKIRGKNLLDMACGTGTHAKKLVDNGFQVVGVDINSEMLKLAKNKTKKVNFIKGSMQSFKSKKKFDVITCLYTAINYNKDISELKRTIKNFYNLLNKDGILIFDLGLVNRKEDKKPSLFVKTYSEDNLQIAGIEQGSLSKNNPNIFNVNHLIFVKNRGKVDFEIDEHEVCIFPVKEVKTIMKKNNFIVKIYDNFSLKKYTKKSKRPVFVGKKVG